MRPFYADNVASPFSAIQLGADGKISGEGIEGEEEAGAPPGETPQAARGSNS